MKSLGFFVNEVEAALAYDQAASEHHGDKAQLNFPDLPPQPQMASSQEPPSTPQPTLNRIFPPAPLPPEDDAPSRDAEGLWLRPTQQHAHAASRYMGKSLSRGLVPKFLSLSSSPISGTPSDV
jgi:hypothetical protein